MFNQAYLGFCGAIHPILIISDKNQAVGFCYKTQDVEETLNLFGFSLKTGKKTWFLSDDFSYKIKCENFFTSKDRFDSLKQYFIKYNTP